MDLNDRELVFRTTSAASTDNLPAASEANADKFLQGGMA